MQLPFLNRRAELARLRRVLNARAPGLVVVYGRRRLGKSRLIQTAMKGHRAVYYVGDDRDAALQRESLAREVGTLIPGFEAVRYPDWLSLFERYFREAPRGSVLAIDELPSLVQRSPDLPSVLQKVLDARTAPRHLVIAGSSQRMMHGLALDGAAPLYGRAHEVLKVGPLAPGWLEPALHPPTALAAVEAWSVFGGVPRYWELVEKRRSARDSFVALALDRLGPLHAEPARLLADELDDVARASSILALVASGANRASEIAGRLQLPVTSLSRPLARLLDLGLLGRAVPFGDSPRDGKRSLYRVADPFLRSWYRFVEPNASRLERGDLAFAEQYLSERWSQHVAEAWEELVRLAPVDGQWATGERWWGTDRQGPLELDLIAPHVRDRNRVLVAEVKLRLTDREVERTLADLDQRIARCPALKGRRVERALFVLEGTRVRRPEVVTGKQWWTAARRARG